MSNTEERKLEDMNESELLEVIKTAPFVIGLLEDPTDALQMIAVTQDKNVFDLIDNPCVEATLLNS